MKRVLLIVALAACGGSKKPAVSNTGGSGAASSSSSSSGPVLLKGVQQGDDSCYLQITDEKGADQTVPADFDLCPGAPKDVSKMINTKVMLSWQMANVLSASCEGDTSCGKTDRENVVMSVAPVP
jgi:hypothetical protein